MTVTSSPIDPHSEAVLKRRAHDLAKGGVARGLRAPCLTVLEFRMANEHYALELPRIRTIHPLKHITFIPGAPGFIKGVINLRGEIISVIDLKHFFELPAQEPGRFQQVIILADREMEFGILSDAIIGVTEIPLGDIQENLPSLAGPRQEYLKGVTDKGVAILNAEKLLKDKKMVIAL